MKADLSRPHDYDSRNHNKYRRVLMQQGRVMLDSDFNALVDANESRLRDLARAMACERGSPDLGFLVTPGKLLCVFNTLDCVDTVNSSGYYLDYAPEKLYKERFPSLCLDARAAPKDLTVRFAEPKSSPYTVAVWVTGDSGAKISANGKPLTVSSNGQFEKAEVPAAAGSITFNCDGGRVWIGLIEESTTGGTFCVHPGRYLVGGFEVRREPDQEPITIPSYSAPNPDLGTELKGIVVYLEIWEQHVCGAEDSTILEPALGQSLDTTTRTMACAQVRAASLVLETGADTPTRELIRSAFDNVFNPTATLAIKPRGEIAPLASENRLHLFEVHWGGDIARGDQVHIKWSRRNGSELYRVAAPSDRGARTTVLKLLDADPSLDGDFVELLTSNSGAEDVDVWSIHYGSFQRPMRRSGSLYRARRTAPKHVELTPLDGTSFDGVEVSMLQGAQLRRWDHVFAINSAARTRVLDGLELTFNGATFEAGDYWQYVQRSTGASMDATLPHGPERLFVPLALLSPDGKTLDFWCDDRFTQLGELNAHAIRYDGNKADVPSWTLQQVLDLVLERQAAPVVEAVSAAYLARIREGHLLAFWQFYPWPRDASNTEIGAVLTSNHFFSLLGDGTLRLLLTEGVMATGFDLEISQKIQVSVELPGDFDADGVQTISTVKLAGETVPFDLDSGRAALVWKIDNGAYDWLKRTADAWTLWQIASSASPGSQWRLTESRAVQYLGNVTIGQGVLHWLALYRGFGGTSFVVRFVPDRPAWANAGTLITVGVELISGWSGDSAYRVWLSLGRGDCPVICDVVAGAVSNATLSELSREDLVAAEWAEFRVRFDPSMQQRVVELWRKREGELPKSVFSETLTGCPTVTFNSIVVRLFSSDPVTFLGVSVGNELETGDSLLRPARDKPSWLVRVRLARQFVRWSGDGAAIPKLVPFIPDFEAAFNVTHAECADEWPAYGEQYESGCYGGDTADQGIGHERLG